MAFLDLEAQCSSNIVLEEYLDFQDPLRHLMQQQDDDGLVPASELLNVLPQQHHSVEGSVLKLSFLHQWDKHPNPMSIALRLDASPGCGGQVWAAGQVQFTSYSASHLYSLKGRPDPCKLLGAKGT